MMIVILLVIRMKYNDYENMSNIILDIIYKKVDILIDKTKSLSENINIIDNQIDLFKDGCLVFKKKREEYLNGNVAECESIKRMNFHNLEKPFDIYQSIININLSLLTSEYEKIISEALLIADYFKEYVKYHTYLESNKLIKKKQLFELKTSLSYAIKLYLVTTEILVLLNDEIIYSDKNNGIVKQLYKDPLLYN